MKDVFIAFIDDFAIGSVGVQIRPDDTAYLNRFGVRFSCHNIGIGKSLMNLADKLLMSRDIKSVYLHTASKYFGLVRFYYNRGFYIDSVTKDSGYASALMVKEYN
jgi:ribosomal protein S18 acetylase RimI-like enzyme